MSTFVPFLGNFVMVDPFWREKWIVFSFFYILNSVFGCLVCNRLVTRQFFDVAMMTKIEKKRLFSFFLYILLGKR